MAKKTKYPKGFYAHSPPKLYVSKPNKIIPAYQELAKMRLYDSEELYFEEGRRYKISLNLDYGCTYYPGDCPSIEAYLIEFSEEDVVNPNYELELRRYNRYKKKHTEELAEWNKWKAIWDDEEAKAKEIAEREILKKLKTKYES